MNKIKYLYNTKRDKNQQPKYIASAPHQIRISKSNSINQGQPFKKQKNKSKNSQTRKIYLKVTSNSKDSRKSQQNRPQISKNLPHSQPKQQKNYNFGLSNGSFFFNTCMNSNTQPQETPHSISYDLNKKNINKLNFYNVQSEILWKPNHTCRATSLIKKQLTRLENQYPMSNAITQNSNDSINYPYPQPPQKMLILQHKTNGKIPNYVNKTQLNPIIQSNHNYRKTQLKYEQKVQPKFHLDSKINNLRQIQALLQKQNIQFQKRLNYPCSYAHKPKFQSGKIQTLIDILKNVQQQ